MYDVRMYNTHAHTHLYISFDIFVECVSIRGVAVVYACVLLSVLLLELLLMFLLLLPLLLMPVHMSPCRRRRSVVVYTHICVDEFYLKMRREKNTPANASKFYTEEIIDRKSSIQ